MNSPGLDTPLASQHADETRSGQRFAFGDNWRDFLQTVDETRIAAAIKSLQHVLSVQTMEGSRFVDIGSGSGLFSLAAHRLGADVTSLDYDPASVGCTNEMRDRYAAGSANWRILHASVLDRAFLESLGTFDIVYSWGVLHHTGNMWQAIYNVLPMVRSGGTLFISLYNDQGVWSKRWKKIKHIYCSGTLGKIAVSSVFLPYWTFRSAMSDLIRLHAPWHTMVTYKRARGMSMWHDAHDWLGGYPFEVAKPEAIIFPIQNEGFTLTNLNTQFGSMGCVEYVFKRLA